MGNFNCFKSNEIDQLLENYYQDIDDLNELHRKKQKENEIKIQSQQNEIDILKGNIEELTRRCDQLTLDYYNLEQKYFKCQNKLGSFYNIFSL